MARKKTQAEIPGTERAVDEDVSDAAEALHRIRTERMDLTQKESVAAGELIAVMREKGLETYVDEDLEIKVTLRQGRDKVSVTRLKTEDAEVDIAAE